MEQTAEIPQLKTNIGADGKERPRQVARKPVTIFNPSKREERAVQNPAVVERMAGGGNAVYKTSSIRKWKSPVLTSVKPKFPIVNADKRRT